MDTRAFAEGYHTIANHHFNQSFDGYDEAVEEQMEGSRKWASFFDDHLTDFLKNRCADHTPQQISNDLYTYQHGWVAEHGSKLRIDIVELSQTHPNALRSLNELSFHDLTITLLPMWRRLLTNESDIPMKQEAIASMQLNLALMGTSLQVIRDRRIEQQPDKQEFASRIDGQLTEIDSAIALLEMMRIDAGETGTNLMVVPAPPKFEAGYHNRHRACDFMVVDMAYGQVRGVQSKTHLTQTDIEKYDPAFISFIDGMTDLKNVVVAGPGSVDTGPKLAPRPGLIALDYLVNRTNIKDIMRNKTYNGHMPWIIQKHAYAKAQFGTRRSVIEEAGYVLGNRLYEELYSA